MKNVLFFLFVCFSTNALGQGVQPFLGDRPREFETLAEAKANVRGNDSLVVTKGYSSPGDGGGNEYVHKSTGWSALSAAQQSASGFYIRVGATDAYLEAKDKSVIRGKQFGMAADGVTNDSAAMLAMINATQLDEAGWVIEMPAKKTIIFSTDISKVLTKPLKILGNDCTIATSVTFGLEATSSTSYATTAHVLADSTTVTLDAVSGIAVGDVLKIESDVLYHGNGAGGAGWDYTCADTRQVVAISGNTVTLDSPSNLEYLTTDTVTVTVFKKIPIHIERLKFAQTAASKNSLSVTGFSNSVIQDCSFTSTQPSSNGLNMLSCVNCDVIRNRFAKHTYGTLLNLSRFVRFNNTYVDNCTGHPISIGRANSNITINGLYGQMPSTGAAVESHPGWYTTYRNVDITGGALNCRCFGVHLENVTIRKASQARYDIGPTETQVDLSARFPHLKHKYDVVLKNVDIQAEQLASVQNMVTVQYPSRKIQIDSCTIPGLWLETSASANVATKGSFIRNSRLGHFNSRRDSNPLIIESCVFDKSLLLEQTAAFRLFQNNPIRIIDCFFTNFSGPLITNTTWQDLKFINCKFGTFTDLYDTAFYSPPASGIEFIDSTITLTADSYGLPITSFTNCVGTVAGKSITSVNKTRNLWRDYSIDDRGNKASVTEAFTFNNYASGKITITGNDTDFQFASASSPGIYTGIVEIDGTGSYTGCDWTFSGIVNGLIPTVVTNANTINYCTVYYDGTDWNVLNGGQVGSNTQTIGESGSSLALNGSANISALFGSTQVSLVSGTSNFSVSPSLIGAQGGTVQLESGGGATVSIINDDIGFYTPNTGTLVLPSDADPQTNVTTPTNGAIKYDSTAHEILVYINGAWYEINVTAK